MSISGKFGRASKTTYRDGKVLVGFCGDIWPRDLRPEQIQYIKTFYHMPADSQVEIFNDWPEDIEPAFPAAKANFKNGYMLIAQ